MKEVIEAIEKEIRRREAVLADPEGDNMFLDLGASKPRPAKVSEIKGNYERIGYAVSGLFKSSQEGREIRQACVAEVARIGDARDASSIIEQADKLAKFIMYGKAKPEGDSNG